MQNEPADAFTPGCSKRRMSPTIRRWLGTMANTSPEARLPHGSRLDWRHLVLAAAMIGSLVLLAALDPIPQDLRYHGFAGTRRLLGIANCFDVISNLPFLVAGILGLRVTLRRGLSGDTAPWLVVFAGIAAVSGGSAYYHLAPDNGTLVWDRLFMTIAFMGLLTALLGEHVGVRWARYALVPAVMLGIFSVWYWHATDDLRLYAWVQFMPLAVATLVMALFRGRYSHRYLLLAALGGYALAKLAEMYDAEIFLATGEVVSGHTVKHLLAAGACYVMVEMVSRRDRI